MVTPIGGPGGYNNPCLLCDGTGEIDGEYHTRCLGTGYYGGYEVSIFLKGFRDYVEGLQENVLHFRSDVLDELEDLKNKVDDIMAGVQALIDAPGPP